MLSWTMWATEGTEIRNLQHARLTLIVALALGALCGCGHSPTHSAGPAAGSTVFASARCGSCHTLSAAGTHGQIGPNLDQLRPDYRAVVRQVTRGGNGMPSFRGTLGAGSIRAVAAFVSRAATQSSTPRALVFVPDSRTPAQCAGNDFACLRQAYGNIAFRDGPQVALSRLDRAQRASTVIAGFCHQITHEIGHAALARYHGDAAKALGQGAMTCWSGYYHGVVERAFSGVPRERVSRKAATMCASLASEVAFVRYQCVHGLGHGLMIYSGGDLHYSLRVCDALPTAWDRTSCTGGVFMQAFLPPTPGMTLSALRMTPRQARDLIYPCNAVGEADKLYCYLQITSRILPKVNYDWSAAARWCRHAEQGWAPTCFQSLGRDVSGYTRENPRQILALCAFARSDRSDCLYGAVRDVTSNDAGGKRATELCLLEGLADRDRCFAGVGTILGGLATDTAGRRALCDRSTPRAYRKACYGGAAAT